MTDSVCSPGIVPTVLDTTLTLSQILQGEDDTVVPQSQAQVMYDTIKARGGVAEMQVRVESRETDDSGPY